MFTPGLTEEFLKVHGLITTWMELEFTLGQMVENTQASTKTIKSMDMENTFGRTVECTLASGLRGNSTVSEITH